MTTAEFEKFVEEFAEADAASAAAFAKLPPEEQERRRAADAEYWEWVRSYESLGKLILDDDGTVISDSRPPAMRRKK